MERVAHTRTAEATRDLGAALASCLRPHDVVVLTGELGAGKTTLARGLLRALGQAGRIKSPTYSLVELYPLSSLNLYHFDFYRFKDREEWLSSGFRDYFNPHSACIVEWPERAEGLIAPPDLDVLLEIRDQARQATAQARSPAGSSWLSQVSFS